MVYIQSTVNEGVIKLPDKIKITDGSRVIVTVFNPGETSDSKNYSEKFESEDVEFIRACRGRLAKQMQNSD